MKITKRFLTLSCLAFIFFLPALSAQDWSTVHPFPEYNRYLDGDFRDDGRIILVGNQGKIIKSTNGGQDWEEQAVLIDEPLNHIQEIPGTNGAELLLASESKIFKSTDGGETWVHVTPDYTFDDVIDIEIVSASLIYVSDRSTSIFKSTDGGNTWTDYQFAEEHFIWDFSFVTDDHGWGLTPQREVYLTTDGGVTWDSISSVPSGAGRGIGFVDMDTGYIAGTTSHFYKTTDGGLTWTEHDEQGYANNVSNFTIVNESLFYAVNNGGTKLYYSTDGGANWDSYNATDYVSNKYYKLKIQDDGTFWLLGDFQTVTSSSDQGETWTDLFPANKYNIPHLRFVNENLGFAAGRYSPLLKTEDGGVSWSVANNSPENILGLEVGVDGILFESRTYQGVWASTDNGLTWEDKLTDVSAIRTIHVSPGGTLYAGSGIAEANIYRSLDNGNTWDTLASPMDIELRGLAFASDEIGFGWEGENLISTSDGGESWSLSNISFIGDVRKMRFLNPLNGWMLTSSRLYKTIDGGATWEVITRPILGNNFIFKDSLIGWATGGTFAEGNIYKTIDGGDSWDLVHSGNYSFLDIQISKADPERIVAVGIGGVIVVFEEFVSGLLIPINAKPLSIYPNPGSNYIVLDQDFGNDALFQLYNIQGQLIQEMNLEQKHHQKINTENLIPGQYFIRVIGKEGQWTGAWIRM